jgi:hypothetical protein
MAWWHIALFIASLVISVLTAPKIKSFLRGPGEFQAPTAEEGREIPVLFGCRDITGPNVVWYGDLGTTAITQRVRTSLFKKKRITVGYRYFVGLHFGLCCGPIDRLTQIKVGGKVAWTGNSTGGAITINEPGLFGGESSEGGIVGTVDFATGSYDQAANAYLATQLDAPVPAFRGTAAAVLNHVYIGTNPYLKPWAFRATRIWQTGDGSTAQWYQKAEIRILSPFDKPQKFFFALDSLRVWTGA